MVICSESKKLACAVLRSDIYARNLPKTGLKSISLACLEAVLISETDDFTSTDEDVDEGDVKTSDNAVDNGSPGKDEGKAADNDVKHGAPNKVIW